VILVVLATGLQLSAAGATQGQTLDRILAIVDGQVITHSDVRAFIDLKLVPTSIDSAQEAAVLTFLIERRLILDQVDRFVISEPSSEIVEAQLDVIRSRFATEVALMRVLDRVGLTPDDLRQVVSDDIRRDAYLADRFAVLGAARREVATSEWIAELVRRGNVRRVSRAR
jgi:uncharacterized protein (DUF1499 family)